MALTRLVRSALFVWGIAPSPTGYIHLGTARTHLYNLAFRSGPGRKFILRVDDTDLERNRPGYEQAIYDGLRLLGLSWDGGRMLEAIRAIQAEPAL